MDRHADDSLNNAHRNSRWAKVLCVLLLGLALFLPHGSEQQKFISTGVNPFDALGKLFGGAGQPDVLPPDKAFRLNVTAQGSSSLLASWRIADGYYLYRDKFRFTLKDGDGLSLGKAIFPKGRVEQDEFFGRVEIYTQELLQITLPLRRRSSGAQAFTLKVRYQGCAKVGICYPPVTKRVNLKLPAKVTSEGTAPRDLARRHVRVVARHELDRASFRAPGW